MHGCRGNHDNLVVCGNATASSTQAINAQIYDYYFVAKPYDSRDIGGWKIVALNAMYGYTWDPTDSRCNTM